MLVDALDGSSDVSFEPLDSVENDTVDPQLVEAVENLYLQGEENLGRLIASLQIAVEQKKDDAIRSALEESRNLREKAAKLNEFLKHLEAALANPDAKKINLADQSALVQEVHQLILHDLLTKTEWTRAEAEVLCKVIPRSNEQFMNEISDKMREINQMVEDRHELLTIFRELLKMWREMHELFIRNQKV